MTNKEMALLAAEAEACAEFLFRVAKAAGTLRLKGPGYKATIMGVDNATPITLGFGDHEDIATLGYNAIKRLREVRQQLDLPDLSETALTQWDVFHKEALADLPRRRTCH